jgi:hypothetical protein
MANNRNPGERDRSRPRATTAAELVDALREFRRRYNGQRLIARHGSRTPDRARADFTTGSRVLGTGPPSRRVG